MNLSETMLKMHEKGEISDEILLLYGMSGDLPTKERYQSLEDHEKTQYWSTRMEQRLGPNWRERFDSLPALLKRVVSNRLIPSWLKDGF